MENGWICEELVLALGGCHTTAGRQWQGIHTTHIIYFVKAFKEIYYNIHTIVSHILQRHLYLERVDKKGQIFLILIKGQYGNVTNYKKNNFH